MKTCELGGGESKELVTDAHTRLLACTEDVRTESRPSGSNQTWWLVLSLNRRTCATKQAGVNNTGPSVKRTHPLTLTYMLTHSLGAGDGHTFDSIDGQ